MFCPKAWGFSIDPPITVTPSPTLAPRSRTGTSYEANERVAHPVVGEKRHPRPGFRISGAEIRTRASAPLFDGATDEILRTVLGRSAAEIADLRERGVIGGTPAGSQLPT